MTEIEASGRVDGRTARAERTRSAVVDAHLALITEGDLRPTGERIATRAGVSLRALWMHFKDMETLFAASGERLLAQQDAVWHAISAELPLSQRVAEFCEQRARQLEIIAPSARAARLREPFSPQLRRNRARYIAQVREEIDQLFGRELAAAGARREHLRDALTVACTFSAWSMLRDELGLEVERATAAMLTTVGALLQAAVTGEETR